MAKRSKVEGLPAEVRTWLDKTLAAGNFSGYDLLEEELRNRGFSIGKSSIHRYGQQLEQKLAAVKASTEAARAIADAAPDDADLRSAAVMSMVQTQMFDMLVLMQDASDPEADPVDRIKVMSKVAEGISKLSRATVNQRKWEIEIRDKVTRAADQAARLAKKGGMSPALQAELRASILGITKK